MTYVGNEMGKKNIKQAKKYALGGLILFVIFIVFFLTLLTVFRQQWADFYSENSEVSDLILEVFPVFVFGFFIADGLQGTISGILKGINQKELVTYSTLLVYYIIGIPLILFFSCKWGKFGLGEQVYGIWFAFMIVNAILALLYIWVSFYTDWNKQADIICQKVEEQHKLYLLRQSINQDLFDDEEITKTQLTNSQLNKAKVEPSIEQQQTFDEQQNKSSVIQTVSDISNANQITSQVPDNQDESHHLQQKSQQPEN